MHKRVLSAVICVVVCAVMLFCSAISTAALDDKYTIDELKMSLKIPKEYSVITRASERGDEAFSTLGLDYDETMTAFDAADIYLQAVSDDGVLKITLTKTNDENSEAIHNYSQISSSERAIVLDAFMDSGNYTSGVEIKHNGIIYFDLGLTRTTQSGDVFCYQCHTVVNGMNINLTLQKAEEELTADEIKVVTNIANTISFDKITGGNGPTFEWWRVLLWLVIVAAIIFVVNYFYSLYNKSKKEQKVHKRRAVLDSEDFDENELLFGSSEYTSETGNLHTLLSDLGMDKNSQGEIAFDELLGYDTTDYHERANTELDSFDIRITTKDKSSGVSYFEDGGKSINKKSADKPPKRMSVGHDHSLSKKSSSAVRTDDTSDYFDDFFADKSDYSYNSRSSSGVSQKKHDGIFTRLAYFGSNIRTALTKKGSSKHKNR